jgi:preprotein translocase subunit SecY
MTKPQVLGLKKSQVLGLKLNYSSLINTIFVLSAILLSPRGTWGGTLSKGTQAR